MAVVLVEWATSVTLSTSAFMSRVASDAAGSHSNDLVKIDSIKVNLVN